MNLSLALSAQVKTAVQFGNADNSALQQVIAHNLSALLTEMNTAFVDQRDIRWENIDASEAARNRISTLWNTSRFRCTEALLKENLLRTPGGQFQIRHIPLQLEKEATEEAVITINEQGHIEDLYFGIEQHQYRRLMADGRDLTDFHRRQMILDFLENFRTAYNRQDLELLEQTFSENALIIVGRVINVKPDSPDMMASLGQQKVELIRYNKSQYIDNLKKVFNRNRFIDVRFDNIDIIRHGARKEIYGVNLRQQWRSSTYGDEGYLFLMIDFEDQTRPMVHVRSWQPEKHTTREDVIELGDFDIIK
ncbi:MAG: nuclear transport factor 2 family protein [Cryomorphaceae bacterium]|nr:MAG: nuclear transport factor 2 family protein [Cryomorphaceae bacterium]